MPEQDFQERLDALRAWWRYRVSSETDPSSLPTEDDLRRIANANGVTTVDALVRLPLLQRAAVLQFADEILRALGVTGAAPSAPAGPEAPADSDGDRPDVAPAAEDDAAWPRREVPTASPRREWWTRPPTPAPKAPPTAPAPTASPAPPAPAEDRQPTATAGLDPAGFAEYDPEQPPRLAPARVVATPEAAGLRLRWPPAGDGPVTIYRVVTSDEFQPPDPESGRPVVTTTATEAVDGEPLRSCVRHVRVWANSGSDEASARRAQPDLAAEETIVAPLAGCAIREVDGIVTGSWEAAPGLTRVEVERIRADLAGRVRGPHEEYAICGDSDNLAGFVDYDCVPGQTYEYRAFAVWRVDQRELFSEPVAATVAVPAPLSPVDDLQVVPLPEENGRSFVSVRWTPPATGNVVLYRTPTGPMPGSEDQELPEDALPQARLVDAARLRMPPRRDGGHATLSKVPWPYDWPRVFFTPVTLGGGRARIGRSVTIIGGPPPPTDVQLVQRVSWQLLTFSWPRDTAQVRVFVTPRGAPPPASLNNPTAQIDKATYETEGGMRLRAAVLPRNGFDVHLVPVAFFGGQTTAGNAVTVPGRPLLLLRYQLTLEGNALLRRRRGGLILEVHSDVELPRCPALVLVGNKDRLPLAISDGVTLQAFAPLPLNARAWTRLGDVTPPKEFRGFLRVFADVPPNLAGDVAVIDPPLSSLQW
jgi:hypothetical protein